MKKTTWPPRLASALLALLLALSLGGAYPAHAEEPVEMEEQISLKKFFRKIWETFEVSDELDEAAAAPVSSADTASDPADAEQNILKKGLKGIFSGLKFLTHGMLEELDDFGDIVEDYLNLGASPDAP